MLKTTTSFVLQHHFWEKTKGSNLTAPAEHYDLRLDIPGNPGLVHFYLREDPTKVTQLMIELKPWAERKWLNEEGTYPPGTSVNPSKDLPATIKTTDRGSIIVLEDEPETKKIDFRGNLLRGIWSLRKDMKTQKWLMKIESNAVKTR